MSSPSPPIRSSASLRRVALALGGMVLTGGVLLAASSGQVMPRLIAYESAIRDYHAASPAATYGMAWLACFVAAALSFPVVVPFSLLYGWLFGFWPALLLVNSASTAGATMTFLFSRYCCATLVERRFGARLEPIRLAFDRDGALFLLSLRLLPIVPSFAVNWAMGLTRVRMTTFWWVSQIGILPASLIALNAAVSLESLDELQRSGMSSLLTPRLWGSLTALAVLPWGARWTLRWLARRWQFGE